MRQYWQKIIEEYTEEDENSLDLSLLKQCIIGNSSEDTLEIICSGEFVKNYITQNILSRIKEDLKKKSGITPTISITVDTSIADINTPEDEEEEKPEVKTQIDIETIRKGSNLNGYYRFENFIRGTTNNFAVAAAMRVAEMPGREYNPLYIYGGVGIGKTHILEAIGNHYLDKSGRAKICYIDGSGFRDEFVSGILSRKPNQFKAKYRSLDMLLLDDLQLLETAQETSKELFDIFQTLEAAGKQMVFVSDRPPKELQNIEGRLKNRFEKSLILPIEPPQYETRIAIIEKKLSDIETNIDRNIIEYIAENITTDIRKLEGAIKSYISIRDLMNITPTLEECIEKEIFKNYITTISSVKGSSVKQIIKSVAKYYGVGEDDIVSQSRNKYITKIRHIAMYLSSEYSSKSTTEIGIEFRKDHASVIYARDKIADLKKTDIHFANELTSVISNI